MTFVKLLAACTVALLCPASQAATFPSDGCYTAYDLNHKRIYGACMGADILTACVEEAVRATDDVAQRSIMEKTLEQFKTAPELSAVTCNGIARNNGFNAALGSRTKKTAAGGGGSDDSDDSFSKAEIAAVVIGTLIALAIGGGLFYFLVFAGEGRVAPLTLNTATSALGLMDAKVPTKTQSEQLGLPAMKTPGIVPPGYADGEPTPAAVNVEEMNTASTVKDDYGANGADPHTEAMKAASDDTAPLNTDGEYLELDATSKSLAATGDQAATTKPAD